MLDPMQVRCFMGDDEQRWYMWYDGYSEDSAASNRPFPACVGAIFMAFKGPNEVTGIVEELAH